MKVTWDQDTCSHAGKCVQGSPEVFKVVDGNFVINESAASEQEVRATCVLPIWCFKDRRLILLKSPDIDFVLGELYLKETRSLGGSYDRRPIKK